MKIPLTPFTRGNLVVSGFTRGSLVISDFSSGDVIFPLVKGVRGIFQWFYKVLT